VKDQGKGSSLGQVRATSSLRARETHKGAGLAAAYDIVRQHGGRIEAKVNVRKGFEFSVWLTATPETSEMATGRVLVVEDDDQPQAGHALHLEKARLQHYRNATAEEAFADFGESP